MPTESNGITYVIFNVSELPDIDFTQVLQTSAETCRKSVDGTQTLVKWYSLDGIPSCVQTLTTKSQYYTHDEILEIMSTPAWQPPFPNPNN